MTEVGEYRTAFDDYVDLARRRVAKMEQMRGSTREAIAQAEAIRADQKAQLTAGRANSAKQVDDKTAKADEANRIIKWALDARTEEKNFILRKDERYKQNVEELVTDIITTAKTTRAIMARVMPVRNLLARG